MITLDKPRASIVDMVMREINNFFFSGQAENGTYQIQSGVISLYHPDIWVVGQYIALEGSLLHDGVYLLSDTKATLAGAESEPEFFGRILGLKPPLDFIELCLDIQAYLDANTSGKTGRLKDPSITSETYRGYTYHKATAASGLPATWKDSFKDRLSRYKKMFERYNSAMTLTPDVLFERDMERGDTLAKPIGPW